MSAQIYFKKSEKKFLDIYWYQNNTKTQHIDSRLKAMHFCLSQRKKTEQVVCRKSRFQYLYGIVNENIIKNMIQEDHNLFEIIPENGLRKVYFDIDCKKKDAKGNFLEHLEACKKIISGFFTDAVFQISGSESEDKYSYHIILSNYHAKTNLEMYRLTSFCACFADYGFDPCVYTKNRMFKCINQSKGYKTITNEENKKISINDTRIQSFIEGSEKLSKHLIMFDFADNSKDIMTLNFEDFFSVSDKINLTPKQKRNKIEYRKSAIDISEIEVSSEQLPFEFDYNNASPLERLNVLPNNDNMHHNIQFKVMIWCKNRDLLFEDFWQWSKKKNDSPERKTRYYDYWRNSNYTIDHKFIDKLLEQFYPRLKENYNFHRYETLCDISSYTSNILDSSSFLSCSDISDHKIQILAVGCGKNKTGTTIEYIRKFPEAKIVIIVPRISLAYDFCGRLEKEGLVFANYKTMRSREEIAQQDRIIISAESLYKLNIHTYDIVIIDEFETLINAFFSTKTHREFIADNWKKMNKLIHESKKTFLMDAITTLKTVNYVKYLGYNDFNLINNIRVFEREIEIVNKPRTAEITLENGEIITKKLCELDHERLFFSALIKSLQNGEKCFVFMPYKEGRKEKMNSPKHCIRGVMPLVEYICKTLNFEKGKDIEGYYSEAYEEKRDLKDVNKVWKNMKCIITNTCSSVGINYDQNDFDKVFIYYASWVNPRDIIQATKRPRKIKNNRMIMYVEKSQHSLLEENLIPNTFRCDIYEKMKNIILIERNCFCKEALFYLCKHNGIKILNKKAEFDYVESTELVKFEESDDFRITFDKIDDIVASEVAVLKEKNSYGEISLYEKYKLEKYFFVLFNDYNEPDIEDVKFMWMYRNYIKCFQTLSRREYHSINRLLEHFNNHIFTIESDFEFEQDGYIPKNFELKQFQFTEDFIFKDIEKNMGQSTYMKVINSFFGEHTLTYNIDPSSREIIKIKNKKGKQICSLKTSENFVPTLELYKKHNRGFNKKNSVYNTYLIEADSDESCEL